MPERREELLSEIADHVIAAGVGDLSLRPLAAAAGTNARMLLYHFGSKEKLLGEVLAECAKRRLAILEGCEGGGLMNLWNCVSSRRADPHMRLAIEVEVLAAQGRPEFRGPAKAIAAEWLRLVESLGASRPLACAAAAGLRGLLINLHSTGDRTRANAAAHELAKRLGL
jgi:AcrR family transcriptional regulator